MITIVMKDGTIENFECTVDRDGLILMVYNEDGLVAEFNDTWSHWYEHSTIRKEE